MTDVKPGQIWADNDGRSEGRLVRVLAVDETHATVQSPSGRGRKTRIRLDRFRPTSTGYRLVEDAPRWVDIFGAAPNFTNGQDVNGWLDEQRGEA